MKTGIELRCQTTEEKTSKTMCGTCRERTLHATHYRRTRVIIEVDIFTRTILFRKTERYFYVDG